MQENEDVLDWDFCLENPPLKPARVVEVIFEKKERKMSSFISKVAKRECEFLLDPEEEEELMNEWEADRENREEAYFHYLSSDHWRGLRTCRIKIDERKCCQCGSDKNLQVHHKKYRGCWTDTKLEDLITLCSDCHKQQHD